MKKSTLLTFISALALSACIGDGPDTTPVLSSILPPVESRLENKVPRVPAEVAKSIGDLYEAPELERELSSIAARLRESSDKPSLRYSVTILNSSSVNAFALPDGQIFVTRGLLALANDEAEIASVLAHEMAHIEAQHTIERMEQAQSALLASRVVMEVLGDKRAAQAALVSGALSLASFSRKQELEADQIGIKIAARAGYDPYGAARFLGSLDQAAALEKLSADKSSEGGGGNFFATHPTGPQRVKAAIMNARQWSGRGVGRNEHDTYLAQLDGLIYGDDPRSGLIRGLRFIHPYFGFAFIAPLGFKLENTHQAVLGLASSDRALRFDKLAKIEGSLEAQLRSSAAPDLKIEKITSFMINGLPAATALAHSPGWTFRLVLIAKGSDVYRFIFVTRKFDANNDAAFIQSANSFHELQQDEVAISQPSRVRVIEIMPGDTIESLAARMEGVDHPLERFLVLNGINKDQGLQPGARIKIIGVQ
jgi:predicted Zn-dependent protease